MLQAKKKSFETTLQSKYENYQKFQISVQKKIDNNEITGMEFDRLQKEDLAKREAIANFENQRGQELQLESLDYTTKLMNKISEAGKKFSKEHGIDILLFYQKGGQVIYFSDHLDVTNQFIKFLNKYQNELMDGEEDTENVEVSEEK